MLSSPRIRKPHPVLPAATRSILGRQGSDSKPDTRRDVGHAAVTVPPRRRRRVTPPEPSAGPPSQGAMRPVALRHGRSAVAPRDRLPPAPPGELSKGGASHETDPDDRAGGSRG